jgi:predicted phage baseplate assembly protein
VGSPRLGASFPAFSPAPAVDDALVIGLTEPVPANAVRLQFRCHIDGVGVDPTNPPLAWEAWDGERWLACEVDHDDTGGLNREGEIVLHIPAGHAAGVLDSQRAGWIRARVVDVEEGQPPYSSSPIVHAVTAGTVGGTVDAIHAEILENETLGVCEGTPSQRFSVQAKPVLSGAGGAVLEVSSDEGWEEWTEVGDFAASGPDDCHYVFDAVSGEVVFGPAVREADGSLRQYGACPPNGAHVRMRSYSVGGGRRGNVSAGAIQTLKSSIPFVSAVQNRRPAQGGVDGEDLDSAKKRGPILLRTRSRAVTAEDFEQLAREAAPELRRVRCATTGDDLTPGSVKVLLVPAAPCPGGRIAFDDLIPSATTLEKVQERLDEARLVGTRVLIEPPRYQGVTVVAHLRARPRASTARVQEEALERLDSYLNPLIGGPEGDGWPWGRAVQSGEVFAVLQGIRGVDSIEDVRLYGANPATGERGQPTQRLKLHPDALVFSYGHQVLVEES